MKRRIMIFVIGLLAMALLASEVIGRGGGGGGGGGGGRGGGGGEVEVAIEAAVELQGHLQRTLEVHP